METALKLKVPAAELERLRSHPMLAGRSLGEPVEHHLADTYYDSPERELWKGGLTLRVRAVGGRFIQTLRTASEASGSVQGRGEWECELPDAHPRPQLLASQVEATPLAELLRSKDLAARLAPLFENTTRRTTWRIAMADGQQLECALDAGNIGAGEQQASILELGLALKQGDPYQLFRLALDLHQDVPMQLAKASKAARGYALIENAPLRTHKAAPVRLGGKMTLEDAFLAIGANCLEQIETNVPGVLQGDVESLHQMRVGLRRLRALVGMFGDLLHPPLEVTEGLDWLAGELGAARDWDVLAGSTLESLGGFDVQALRDAAAAKAQAFHKQMAQTLRAPHYTRVLLQVGGWLHGRQWRTGGALPKDSPLGKRASRALQPLLLHAEKRLDKRIQALDTNDAHARHRTRIAAKKARYAAEFFQDLLPRRRARRYIGRLAKVQDKLGTLNDFAVADRLLDELKGGNAQVARQAAYARGYLAASTEARTSGLDKALKTVAGRGIIC